MTIRGRFCDKASWEKGAAHGVRSVVSAKGALPMYVPPCSPWKTVRCSCRERKMPARSDVGGWRRPTAAGAGRGAQGGRLVPCSGALRSTRRGGVGRCPRRLEARSSQRALLLRNGSQCKNRQLGAVNGCFSLGRVCGGFVDVRRQRQRSGKETPVWAKKRTEAKKADNVDTGCACTRWTHIAARVARTSAWW